MAINFSYLQYLHRKNLLKKNTRLLDIGCSNLYGAEKEDIFALAQDFGGVDEQFAQDLAEKSAKKEAFAGVLLDRLGIDYHAIDFAEDYKTTKFDLNKDNIPRNFKNSFDIVLNFGTTEHVINQANSFRVIHDAAKTGGIIYHQLPAGGFFNHCYFLYTGRFFFDLAGYNEYALEDFWMGQAGPSDIMDSVRDYSSYFPVLSDVKALEHNIMPDTAANVVYRKVKNQGFRYPMELSTSYTKPSAEETQNASVSGTARAVAFNKRIARKLINRFSGRS